MVKKRIMPNRTNNYGGTAMKENNIDHMTQAEKWKFFKNYLHNELGITKEDIRVWIEEAVKHQATQMIQRSFEGEDVEDLARVAISREVRGAFSPYQIKNEVIAEAGKELAEKLLNERNK